MTNELIPELPSLRYVIISAAYNEALNIRKTIDSLLAQTILPIEWVIVSDGSTDDTDDIVRSYLAKGPFIRFFRVNRESRHSFGAKVHAIRYALENLRSREYDFIGILDADISFGPRYFETMFERFDEDENLGIAGGNIVQYVEGSLERRIKSLNSVAGAVQLFRRACFESTAGFKPIEFGGEDAAIEIEARMLGWKVRTFPDIEVIHYGFVGRGAGSRLKARVKFGKMCYALGYHPIFQCLRLFLHAAEKPFLIGSVAELIGFVSAKFSIKTPALSQEAVRFLRKEQRSRIFSLFSRDRTKISI